MLGFLRGRATPGVELVEGSVYARTLATSQGAALIEVRPSAEGPWLELSLWGPASRELFVISERVRALFDVGVDPEAIGAHLRRDALLRGLVRARPGVRVPGAWDGFEVAVRAVLGQQVSVAGATTLAGRLAERFGARVPADALPPHYRGRLTHLSPTADALAEAPVESIGLPRARASAVRALAAAVASGKLALRGYVTLDEAIEAFTAIPGIGPWTAHYVAMRALREPDAFPASDLGLRGAFVPGRVLDATEVEARAERWRPFRAYAAMHLWTRASRALASSRQPKERRASC
jgi:AraC family transcriptional regulator of adaptative response / DNA-3-methyladenine glycosylase II